MRTRAFATPFGSPRPCTPWLLLQEESQDTVKRAPRLRLRRQLPRAAFLPRLGCVSLPSFRSFQSHSCAFFSAFAHATCSLSVYSQYLGLGFNAPVFIPHTQAALLLAAASGTLRQRGCHSLWLRFPAHWARVPDGWRSTTSQRLLRGAIRFALCGVHSHYLPHRFRFLFLRVLRYFSSPRMPTLARVISAIPGSKADMRLPQAYRSLPRPSSLL